MLHRAIGSEQRRSESLSFSFSTALRWAAAFCVALALAGCSTTRKVEAPAPPPPSFEQLMSDAGQAHKGGDTARAMDLWRDAAKRDPLSKEPWLRMAQVHFDRADYGAAITAAQEAWQRDANDATANGLLAVSGLRVASAALTRMQTDTLTGSTRNEAEALARMLRDVLGTPVLVPPPSPPQPRPTVRPAASKPAATRPTVPSAARQPAATVPAPAAAQVPSRDPFGTLR